jgi:hypothetical protein
MVEHLRPHSVLNMADARHVESVESDVSGYGDRHLTTAFYQSGCEGAAQN